MNRRLAPGVYALCLLLTAATSAVAEPPEAFELEKGDHIAYIGNTLADRMQHSGWLETYIHATFPEHELTFRNLGFPGDEVTTRPRSANFGSPDEWLTKVKADVVFAFFGYNEALRGEAGLGKFRSDLAGLIDAMRAEDYNGESSPRLVFFSPIAHEDLGSPHLPDGAANNANLAKYAAAMREVCEEKKVRFVDIFTPTKKLFESSDEAQTMNGIHLLDHGNRAVAKMILADLFETESVDRSTDEIAALREAVLDKNYHWFSRYRVVDGYNVYGGRSTLAWFGQSNADVMAREMEMFDIMTANRDARVWAVAQGGDLEVEDDNLPAELTVRPNKQGPLDGGRFPYLGGKEAIEKMKVHEGMQVNLFASEEMFPRLANPVQMAVDTDSRLWVSVWPSYPHWNPTKPREDALVILPDEDGDGVADDCIVFADQLNSITGFEFWGGGVLVAAPPEIWFLKDTDGDDKADYKLRMLQGVSSADTHHSANALLVGPDGWLYWSRGIFNVANFETPTKTYRSGQSGVHRFNPLTYEVEFHFPIGPNPHGDVFDQWGYQFAGDGTTGTGSYVDIGKGVGNKQWYTKRVRPVAATGILSSSHFPEEFQGNFLICNTIGFLGVLRHVVEYDGADITAREVEPVVVSSDPNFRPSDIEVGGDGAIYISDWHNTLIGHMQHNMRDPNRDTEHGRVYRVTYAGRPTLTPPKMKGKPIAEVCSRFLAPENGTRYRARLELTGRDASDIAEEVGAWAAKLDVEEATEAQALLECLWVFEQHRLPNVELLATVFRAEEPRVRAAAIRTLGHWGGRVSGWEPTLIAAARDASALVRAEAVKAAVSFPGLAAAEVIFEVATRPTDAALDKAIEYAKRQIDVDALVRDAIASGTPLSKAAEAYTLRNASVADLLRLERTEAVYEAILSRPNVDLQPLGEALTGLAREKRVAPTELLLALIRERDAAGETETLSGLLRLLAAQPSTNLVDDLDAVESLALEGQVDATRQAAFAAWLTAAESEESVFFAASKSKASLRDLLEAVREVPSEETRAELYDDVRALVFELPPNLENEPDTSLAISGIHVDFFHPSAADVAVETLAKMTPKASGVVPAIDMNVPQRLEDDQFALRFTGYLDVPATGRYRFFIASDDGSRIYIDDELVVNHDGLHGMTEKRGAVELTAGPHALTVTYFDNGGGDGLRVQWAGPGMRRQPISPERLSVTAAETVHGVAIRALSSIPGHEEEKFLDLASLVKAGRHRAPAIRALNEIPESSWPAEEAPALIDNLIGYLTTIPAKNRTSGPANDAMVLARGLARKLPEDLASEAEERLGNLDVRVIAIGTVRSRMIFDKERLAVAAAKPVEFRFSNTDDMPHNFAITTPGSLEEVGMLAEETANEPGAAERQYIPESDEILLASRLLEPGQKQVLSWVAPTEPGVYPYVCTYPGHWRRMYGALYVVADLDAYLADPEAYLAENPLPLRDELLQYTSRNTEWKVEDLSGYFSPLPHGRSFEIGKQVFETASCVACHKIGEEGRELGPDLTALPPEKRTAEHLLRSVIEPSAVIDEKYQSNVFVLRSGRIVSGLIIAETDSGFEVQVDPLAKAAPTVVEKSKVQGRSKSSTSIMPEGLLSKLTQEEILDLFAYILAGGDPKHALFGGGHHDH